MTFTSDAARLAAHAGDDVHFRALADAAPVGIAVTEPDTGCVYANQALARIVGRDAASLLASGWRDLLHPDGGAATAQMLLRYHHLRQEFHHRIRIVRPDGDVRWVRIHGAPVAGGAAGRLVIVVEDATAEVEAEQSLARRAAEYRQLVELSDGIIVRISPDGTVQYASPSCETLLGRAPEDVVGRNAFEFVHPDDAEETAAKFLESAAGGEPGPVRFRLIAADGSAYWFDAAAQRRTRVDGSLLDLVVNCRDQSERITAEAALRRSEERYRQVVDSVREVIFQTDAAGRWTFLNAAWTVVSGFTVDETLGRRWIDFVHPDDRPVHRRLVHELFVKHRLHVRQELRGITKDGEPRWLEVAVQALHDDDGRIVGTTGTFNDVTARHEAEEELRRREARFRALVQNASDSITVLDEFGIFNYASPAAERLLGVDAHGIVGQPAMQFIHPDDRDVVVEWYDAVRSGAVSPPLHYRIRHRDGTWRHVESVASNLVDDPVVRGVVVNTRDVTDRRQAEDLLAGQTAVLENIAEGRPLADTLDAIARLLEAHVERTRCAIFRAELPEERLVIGAAPDLPMFPRHVRWAISGDGPVRRAVRDSTVMWSPALDPTGGEAPRRALFDAGLRSAWAVPVIDGAGTTVGAIALYGEEGWSPSDDDWRVMNLCTHLTRIAIERQEAADRLAHQALHDPLTGLPNRALFLDRLAGALARAERHATRVAVLFLDLDRFKVVNDSLGHDRGDLLLIALADRLRAILRAEDTAARFGGDEFTVLCEDLDSEDHARAIADRIAGALSVPFVLDEREVFVTASVGIAFARPHDRPDDLVRDADAAMYRAKELGKARSEIFDEAMRLRAVERLHTENALYRALERSELRLLYQPEVSLRTGEVVGVEALLRWDHPERGLIAPADFIPLAEETGLIVPIGAWALHEACRHAAHWARTLGRKTPLTVWVNLSARQFADSDLPSIVAEALAASGAPPRSVCLEITESVLMADVETTLESLVALHDLGVRLGIDDFGTGYSSLSYLQRFPVDFLKVDRSFVEGLGRAHESRAIVSGVVDLGHALGLGVIAEGVERREQVEHLRRLGCDFAQGFLLAEPQTDSALEALLAERPVLL